jgi:arsenate reductase
MTRILVLCTGNAARSQIAEGLFRTHGNDVVQVYSAGTHPAGFVHPLAIETMKERGIDISQQKSKSLRYFEQQRFDFVITVCDDAQLECPLFPGTYEQLHWSTPDPSFYPGSESERRDAFRRTIDSLLNQILPLLEQLRNKKAASH